MGTNFKSYLNDVRRDHMVRYYEDHAAYFYGKISASSGALVTYFMTGQFVFLVSSICMIAIMLADVGNIRSYQGIATDKDKSFFSWEHHYTFLSTAFMLILGVWCFFCFTLTSNPFIHLLSVAISLGNVLSLICRNFSNQRILTLQLLAVAVPMLIGILHYGDYRSMILLAFFLPLFASVRDISQRLRDLFRSAEQQSDAKHAFSEQLNTALGSMSHGLMMFDDDMRIKVINTPALNILGIHKDTNCQDQTLDEISQFVDMDSPTSNKVRIMSDALTERLNSANRDKIFKLSDDQFVEITLQMRNEGGCVMVIEEVSERIRYQSKIDQLARFDELTGLYNRRFFRDQANQSLKNRKEKNAAAIMFFDLDDFKRVNDNLGHQAGDFILTSVAERLNELLPDSAFAGRYGGDEFVVFVDAKDCPDGFDALADAIVKTIPKDVKFKNQQLRFGVSLGIAKFPEDGNSIDRLLKLGDLALYHSKSEGKNCYSHFTPELEESLQKRIIIEEDLIGAIRNQEFELYFQPIVRMDNGKTELFEALVRWRHDIHGGISPADFIPIAEDLGLIREIGQWTLHEACKQCSRWPDNVSVSVNMSAVQFQVDSITSSIKNALEQSGLDPKRLEIEITETAVLSDMTHAAVVLDELSELGVRISLDDFGTGYSSLSYLHKLPLDKLKIDKSFVDDLDNSQRSRTLLNGIAALGKALELKIVVEGIETKTQYDLLHDNYDVDLAQGFYFSKPMPASHALKFIQLNSVAAYPPPKAKVA